MKELGKKSEKMKDTKNSLRGTRLCLRKQVSLKEAEMNVIYSSIHPNLVTGRIPRTLSGLCKVLKGRLLEANTKISLWTLKETEN